MLPSLVTTSGLISSRLISLAMKASYRPFTTLPSCLACIALQAQRHGDLVADIGRVTGGRLDLEGVNLLRRLVRHFLDVHAAFGGDDEGDAAGGAVHQRREIKFALDGRAVFDIEALDQAARRAGLMGDQGHAQDALGFLLHVLDGFDHLDAAALAAAAGMDLRLHHPDRAAQFLCRRDRFLHREGGLAFGDGHAESAQHLFCLIFVDIHGVSPKGRSEAGAQ